MPIYFNLISKVAILRSINLTVVYSPPPQFVNMTYKILTKDTEQCCKCLMRSDGLLWTF